MRKRQQNRDEETVRLWKKSRDEQVRVGLNKFRGDTYFSLRIWYRDKNNEFKPGRQGISLSTLHLSEICKGVKKCKKRAIRSGCAVDFERKSRSERKTRQL